MTPTDLLNRYAQRRDAEAFAQIVEQYQRLVIATCRRVLRDRNNIDDAVQETFLRLARSAGKLHANVGAWLHRCAINVAIDFNRRQAVRLRHESAVAQSAQTMNQTQQELFELREHLDAALEKLDEADRELIIQRFFTGRPQTELAADAGVSPATMSYRMEQAIARLRKKFERAGGGVIASDAWWKLLEAEHASASVPAKLTANLMKIGLSAPAVTSAGAFMLSLKAVVALIAMLGIGLGGWKIFHHRANIASPMPMMVTGQNGQPLRWQKAPSENSSAVLAGRILDSNDHGIAGAGVELTGGIDYNTYRAKTDAAGNYSFPTVRAGGEYQISVKADGFVSINIYGQAPRLQITTGAQARRDIVMQRGEQVTFLIDTPLNEPIADATIAAFAHNNNPSITARTDDMGTAKIILPRSPEPYTVAVQAAGYAPVHAEITDSMSAVSSSLSWRMSRGQTITGIAICNDGKPAAGWKIEATPTWWTGEFEPEYATIDAAGHFTLHDIGPDQYSLVVQIPRGMSSSLAGVGTFNIASAHQPIRADVPMPSPQSMSHLAGRLQFIGGRPLQIMAMIRRIGAERDYYSTLINATSFRWNRARGAINEMPFDLGPLPAGIYSIQFSASEIEPVTIDKFQMPGKLPLITIKFIGHPQLAGIVRDVGGNAITHFAVRVRKLYTMANGMGYVQDNQWTQVSDPHGKFSVDLVEAGRYQAQISAPGYAWAWTNPIDVDHADSIAHVEINLSTGGLLAGTLLGPDGQPIAGAQIAPLTPPNPDLVDAERVDPENAAAVVSDAAGRFTFPHLLPGRQSIKILAPSFAPLLIPDVFISDSGASDVGSIHLLAGGSAEGTVYDAAGHPDPNISLSFQDAIDYHDDEDRTAGRIAAASTDSNGYFRVEHLPERLISVDVAEYWHRNGVGRRLIHPINGQTTRLDFGGLNAITGRILHDGKPLANNRVQLLSRYFGSATANAITNSDGRFTIYGPPPGDYLLTCSATNNYDDIPLRRVAITRQRIDLGDIVCDTGDVIVRFSADDPRDLKNVWGDILPASESPGFPGVSTELKADPLHPGQWRASNLPPGNFRARIFNAGEGYVNLFADFKRVADVSQTFLPIHLPRSNAQLTVSWKNISLARQAVFFRNADGSVQFCAVTPEKKTFHIPSGEYRAIDLASNTPYPFIPPITLTADKPNQIELDARQVERHARVLAEIYLWSFDGSALQEGHVHLLPACGKSPIEPIDDPNRCTLFVVAPGRYRAILQRPGKPDISRPINIPVINRPADWQPAQNVDMFAN